MDFFCAKLRLALEIDGEVHDRPDVAEYDKWRDELLVARGLKVVRIRNADLTDQRLVEVVSRRQIELGVAPPPPRGGGGRGEGR